MTHQYKLKCGNITLSMYSYKGALISIDYKEDCSMCSIGLNIDGYIMCCHQFGSLNRPTSIDTVPKQYKHFDGQPFINYICCIDGVDEI